MWPWRRRAGAGAVPSAAGATAPEPAPPPQFPSLPFILDEARRSIDAQDRRASGLDQRGGVLIGFAGVLVGVVLGRVAGWDTVLAAISAAAAGVWSAFALSLRVANNVGPEALQKYAPEPLERTLGVVAGSMVLLYQLQEAVIGRKTAALRVSSLLLLFAVGVLVVGMVVRSELIPDAVESIGKAVD